MTDKIAHIAVRSVTVSSRHATPRLAHGHGSERRASARACGTPFSFYQLHKWSTVGPPFKSVKILIDFQCGIKSLAFICGPFNS
jgi:hypothetical protein